MLSTTKVAGFLSFSFFFLLLKHVIKAFSITFHVTGRNIIFIIFCLRSSNNNGRPSNTTHPLQQSQMTVLMAVAFLGLKFITLSQQFNKSKETCRPQRVEEVLLNTVPAVLYALEPKVKAKFFPAPPQMVKCENSFEMSNEKLQAVRTQKDTIQTDLGGHRKKIL